MPKCVADDCDSEATHLIELRIPPLDHNASLAINMRFPLGMLVCRRCGENADPQEFLDVACCEDGSDGRAFVRRVAQAQNMLEPDPTRAFVHMIPLD